MIATQEECAIGYYSDAGASICTACPPGRYGNAAGMTSSACTGERIAAHPGTAVRYCVWRVSHTSPLQELARLATPAHLVQRRLSK